ncbi:hypothetical protein A2U01_0115873, partial [Trifolium medium]|nr:hypothetical protein [Trifolium medium]
PRASKLSSMAEPEFLLEEEEGEVEDDDVSARLWLPPKFKT